LARPVTTQVLRPPHWATGHFQRAGPRLASSSRCTSMEPCPVAASRLDRRLQVDQQGLLSSVLVRRPGPAQLRPLLRENRDLRSRSIYCQFIKQGHRWLLAAVGIPSPNRTCASLPCRFSVTDEFSTVFPFPRQERLVRSRCLIQLTHWAPSPRTGGVFFSHSLFEGQPYGRGGICGRLGCAVVATRSTGLRPPSC
jgi:hypothetical protein